MVIHIPEKLSPLNTLNFSKYVATMHRESEFIYDFSQMQHCTPFGMLIVADAIRKNQKSFPNAEHIPIHYTETQGTEFATYMGFFQMCGWDIGRIPTINSYGETYIPIKKISISSLQEQYLSSTIVLGEMIDRQSNDLAITLTQNDAGRTTKLVQYCLREIIRNAFEHGNTSDVWVCGQYWESRSQAQIAIIDSGCGIYKSLIRNRHYRPQTDKEANELALKPGVTRTYGLKQDPNDVWSNSGYGLYMASTICCQGGSFWLCSGTDATLINSSRQSHYDINYQGTAVCLDIKTNAISDIDRILPEIADKGSRVARQQENGAVVTASKASTIASITRKK